jgi:hypothetical protein
MDESTGGEILRGDSYDVGSRRDDDQPLTRADIAPSVLRAVEQLAQGFDLVKGRATIELQFKDGLFETGWLHRRLTLQRLDEFQPCSERRRLALSRFQASAQDGPARDGLANAPVTPRVEGSLPAERRLPSRCHRACSQPG